MRVWDRGYRIEDGGFGDYGVWFRVQDLGFSVMGQGVRITRPNGGQDYLEDAVVLGVEEEEVCLTV